MYNNFSQVCYHEKTKRINNTFVRCLKCGDSFINNTDPIKNKTSNDFANENKKNINRNFMRNFSNEIIADDQVPKGNLEYYQDQLLVNRIIIDRNNKYWSTPPKYDVYINHQKLVLNDVQIAKLLKDTLANRVK